MKKSDEKWLQMATDLAKKCTPIATAFCVGAVIVNAKGELISTAYSRETDKNKHAEEIAIEKAADAKANLVNATLYSSLEPCGERLSKRKTCVQWIVEYGIGRVVFAEYEPSLFVKGEGEERLMEAGIETEMLRLQVHR